MAVAERSESVAVEPGQPPSEPRREIRPGVDFQTTLRLLVGYHLDTPPVFSTAVSHWTAPTREVGYWVVGLLVSAKELPLIGHQTRWDERPPGVVRRVYRALRSRLAAGLVLPSYRLPEAPRLHPHWAGAAPGFEASRQVFEFKEEHASLRIICHVFAQREGGAADRLLGEFVDEFRAEDEKSELCDIESRLCLLGRSSFRLRRRQYWEIVIGPLERLADAGGIDDALTPLSRESGTGQIAEHERTVGTVTEPQTPDQIVIGSALPDAATMEAMHARTIVDWDFMAAEIGRAIEEGVDLDDDFIEDLAQRRFEHTREVLAVERPGPTLDSSRRIAREVVAIHRIALEGEAGRGTA